MTVLRKISIRPNPKPAKKRAKKKRRSRKVRHRATAHGYLVQGGYRWGPDDSSVRMVYLTPSGTWSSSPSKGKRFPTLKAARDACVGVVAKQPSPVGWVQPVPA